MTGTNGNDVEFCEEHSNPTPCPVCQLPHVAVSGSSVTVRSQKPSSNKENGDQKEYGWVSRQRAKLGAILMAIGAIIHPFESTRALDIIRGTFEE